MSNVDYPEQLAPSGIGEAAKYNFSPWFIKLRFQDQSPMEGRRWKRATKPLSPLQARIGNEFEDKVYKDLEGSVDKHVNQWYDWEDERNKEKLINEVKEVANNDLEKPVMMTQVRLSGKIGKFHISGDADLILLFSTEDGVQINVIDIKSSWDEKPSQQLQTATYTSLIRNILPDEDIDFDLFGGIAYRETSKDDILDSESIPTFNTKSREGDVSRVLGSEGPFDRAFSSSYDEIPLVVDEMSPFAEVTAVQAIEQGDIGILGLTQGEKSKLEREGIETIEDLASLYKPMDDPKPYNYEEPEIENSKRQVVENLREESGLSTRTSTLSYKAQSILGEFNPDHEHAMDQPWMPWLPGSGPGDLPEDDPPYETDLPIRRNSMIRVYLDIQHDHVRDEVVSISGVVTSGKYDGEPLEFGITTTDVNREPSDWRSENEAELLDQATSKIYDTIQFLSDFAGHGLKSPIHFYLYGDDEREKLYEAARRHEDYSDSIESLRSILDSREGIDQSMVSVVQDEIESRMATKDMDISLPSIVERTYPSNDDHKVTESDWTYRDEEGNEIDLQEAYKQGIFDTTIPIKYGEGSYSAVTKQNDNREPDSFYRVLPKRGSQIPVEYLWASEDIGLLDTEWSEKSRQKRLIEDFMWVDNNQKDIRTDSDMFESLSRAFAKCLLHVERSIVYRNTGVTKSPIDIAGLANRDPRVGDMSDACFDYLDLESHQSREDAMDVYSKPLKKRVVDGESVPMIVTAVEEDRGYMFKVRGKLLFSEIGIDNEIEVAGSSKISGGDSNTGGSRCVATPIVNTSNGYSVAVDDPEKVSKSTKVSVEEYNPDEQTIVVKGYRASRKVQNRYVISRIPWTLDGSENGKQYVGPGQALVLDPSPDSMMAEKSIKSLENTDNNKVYNDISAYRSKNKKVGSSKFDSSNCSDYIDYVEPALDFRPNRKQREYIKDTTEYSLLQGPPGTGKTSGAISHAVLSRAYDMEMRGDYLTSLVTGLSNKSIDEVMERISEIKSKMDSNLGRHALENLRLVRLSYGPPSNPVSGVEYLNYQNEDDIEIIRNMISSEEESKQTTLDTAGNSSEHVVVFATPGRIDGLMGNIDEERTSVEMYQDSDGFFDLITIDEASMMPMYQLFMVSTFCNTNSQVLIGGDHRQLPPVRKYEWSEENRKSITYHVPHLSVLDYFRYLRGEDVDGVYDSTPESPGVDVNMVRLRKTYRCHKVVTDFLRESVYKKDGIPYYSEQRSTISTNDKTGNSMDQILDPESPITLIVHDERSSQQINRVEEDIISNLLSNIPEKYDSGIVTPHNAQKGNLRVSCSSSSVDTVERFQGGEKDIMFVSTTVSDPDHLSKEEEFILSENRLNVALSRMKRKLVVVASRSIFEMVPKDVDTYDQAVIWKSLYAIAEENGELDYSGSLSKIGGKTSHNVDIYNIEEI